MALLDLLKALLGTPGLLILKKEFQIRPCGWCIALHEHNHVASR
jgi:hypothetical protein